MALYRITSDDGEDFVEAPSFKAAYTAWKDHNRRENPADDMTDYEPTSVDLLSRLLVIRPVSED